MNRKTEMRWRRRQAKWKTYRLHRARWIFYRTPPPGGWRSWIEQRLPGADPQGFRFYAAPDRYKPIMTETEAREHFADWSDKRTKQP